MPRDTGVGVGLLALAGLYWLGADQIKVSRLEGIVGAQAVPKGLAVSLAILSVLLIAQGLWRARHAAPAAAPAPPGEIEGTDAHLRALGILAIGAGYLLVVRTLGYLPAIALLLLVTARYLGAAWSVRLVGVAIGMALFYYVIFVRLLGIALPPGVWPGLWRAVAG